MPRTIGSSMFTDLGAPTSESALLILLTFNSGEIAMTNGTSSIIWASRTFVPVGGAIAVSSTQERWEPGSSCRLTCSGVEQSILAVILQIGYRGRPAQIWWAHFSQTTGGVVTDPIPIFSGLMNDAWDIQHQQDQTTGVGTVTISTRITERVSDVGRLRGIRTNVHSHQACLLGAGVGAAAGDTGMQNVAAIMGTRIFWGVDAPYTGTLPAAKPPPTTTAPLGPGGVTSSHPSSPFPGLPPVFPWGSQPSSDPWGIHNTPNLPVPP
jgi:hypothetical protein